MKLGNKVLLSLTIILTISGTDVFAQVDSSNCEDSITNFIESNWKRWSRKILRDSKNLDFTNIEPCLKGLYQWDFIKD